MTLGEAWDANANDWIAWARAQDHDGFWGGTWPELAALLPRPLKGPVVGVGCGEGRVGRKLLHLGVDVLGVELSSVLAGSAHHGPGPSPSSGPTAPGCRWRMPAPPPRWAACRCWIPTI